MTDEKKEKCAIRSVGEPHWFCDTCKQLGRWEGLQGACPQKTQSQKDIWEQIYDYYANGGVIPLE